MLPLMVSTGQRLHPLALSVNLNQAPLSTADMTLPLTERAAIGDLIELYTPHGTAGIFRATTVEVVQGEGVYVSLEHGLVTLSDNVIPEKKKKQQTSIREALVHLLSFQTRWALGTVAVPDEFDVKWSYEYPNLLEALVNLMEYVPGYMLTFDQTAEPWLMNVVALTDEDACECRLNRNTETLSVTTDRSELCTRLYLVNAGSMDSPIETDTIGRWGVVERTLSFESGVAADDIEHQVQTFIDDHKNPTITVEIGALELAEATGEPFDRFHLGRMCRVILPDEAEPIRQRVSVISYPDVLAEPDRVAVTLAHRSETAADTMAGLILDNTRAVRSLPNYIRVEELETRVLDVLHSANIGSIITDGISANSVVAGEGDFDNLAFGTIAGQNAGEWITGHVNESGNFASTAVVTGVRILKTFGGTSVMGADGSTKVLSYLTDAEVDLSRMTITYLGKEDSDA